MPQLSTAPDYLADLISDHRDLVDQYFGLWAIEPAALRGAANRVQGTNLVAHVQANGQAGRDAALGRDLQADVQWLRAQSVHAAVGDRRQYALTRSGVAIIRLQGPMMKFASSLSGGTSTTFVRRQIRQAVADDDVGAILLVIDSPGGTVAGTQDLGADIARAAARKPTETYMEDMAASAAYWAGSQARRITAANATTLVGSIGTYAVLHDLSGHAEKLGVAVHVVKAGEFKGAAVPGTVITEQQLQEMQRIVDSLNSEFLAAVSRGRKMDLARVQQLADGRVHPAADAAKLGLVDGVETLDQVLDRLANQTQNRRSSAKMTHDHSPQDGARQAATLESTAETIKPQQATLQELKQLFPEAGNDFYVQQLENQATVQQATNAYAAHLRAENERLQAELKQQAEAAEKQKAELAEQQKARAAGGLGLQRPIGAGTDRTAAGAEGGEQFAATGDAAQDFSDLVADYQHRHQNVDRRTAVIRVARMHPQLHQAFLMATNSSRKAQRQLAEKYEMEMEATRN